MAARSPKIRTRYSIGEWYGRPFELMSPKDRVDQAKLEIGTATLTGLNCPFQHNRICTKKGGVCSLRKYEQKGAEGVAGVGPLITTCPNRFLEDNIIFRWVAETILNTSDPLILRQIGFLDRLRATPPQIEEGDEESDFIGRIDNVLVHPTTRPIDWCAVELQAVYFSGKSMSREFGALAATEQPELTFPAAHRRPDWRSSGPKRLLPQLETKVPTIRTWGKKMAVVIDEAFFTSLVGLERERHLSNAEIAWFVVGYDLVGTARQLKCRDVIFSKLTSSVTALTGGVPLPKEKFEAQLQTKISLSYPEHRFPKV